MFSMCDLFNDIPEIHIVDVGASPIDGNPVYQPIINRGGYRCSGFEPNPAQFQELQKHPNPNMTFYPDAIGDGKDGVLNICYAPGMTSLLEPDLEVLSFFHGYGEWGRVVEQQPLSTRRLDDMDGIQEIDFIKLDVQGGELTILENAPRKLAKILVIQTEVHFIPFYKNQPLFGEIDLFMRKAGFLFHRFGPIKSRLFKPLLKDNDIYAGLSQVLEADTVYVRPFIHFNKLQPDQLLKIARILHDVYGSFDLANLALREVDRQTGSKREAVYFQRLAGKSETDS